MKSSVVLGMKYLLDNEAIFRKYETFFLPQLAPDTFFQAIQKTFSPSILRLLPNGRKHCESYGQFESKISSP